MNKINHIRRGLVFGIIFILLASLIVITVPMNVSAAILRVGPGQDYSKIQDAIDAANPGDSIYVYEGTYQEHLHISKSLTISSQGNVDNTIIEGNLESTVVLITADNVIIDKAGTNNGFTIRNSNYNNICGIKLSGTESNRINYCSISHTKIKDVGTGIYLYYAGDDNCGNVISNNNIFNNDQDGIFSWRSNHNTITDNTIESNDYGIYLIYGDENDITQNSIFENQKQGIRLVDCTPADIFELNYIYGNTIRDNEDDGICVLDSEYIKIKNNLIYDNIGTGILMNCCENLLITENGIYNKNTFTQEHGIYIINCKNDEVNFGVLKNDPYYGTSYGIYGNKKNGIFLDNCEIKSGESFEIKENKIFENRMNGIHLLDSNSNNLNIKISDNIVYDNNKLNLNNADGILLEDSDNILIEGNDIYNTPYDNQQYGIHLKEDQNIEPEPSTNNKIKSNLIFDNKKDGIYLDSSNENIIEENEICNDETDYQQNGIHLKDSYDNEILKNYNDLNGNGEKGIYNNMIHGIYFEDCIDEEDTYQNMIENNRIHDNRVNGIEFSNSDLGYIANNNYIFDNWNEGIHLLHTNNVEIIENEIYNNDNGIYIEDNSEDNLIQGNNIYENIINGIYLFQSNKNTISESNIISDNNKDGIYLEESNENIISPSDGSTNKNEIKNNHQQGIHLYKSNKNNVKSNDLLNNYKNGIHIEECNGYGSNSNNINDNDISIDYNQMGSEKNGILIDSSQNQIIDNNDMTYCGIMITGDQEYYWDTHTITDENEINNYPIIYWKNQVGEASDKLIVPTNPPPRQIILADCRNVIVQNHYFLSMGSVGILLGYCQNIDIKGNTPNVNNNYGICLWTENYNILIQDNVIQNCYYAGLYLNDNNGEGGKSNDIYYNRIEGNSYGVIFHELNSKNLIRQNTIKSNMNYGIYLQNGNSWNDIYENNIELNSNYGIYIDTSGGTDIYYNNFIDNGGSNSQACDPNKDDNVWDSNRALGDPYYFGNYWNDHSSTHDEWTEINQDVSGSDGVVDQNDGDGGLFPYDIAGSTTPAQDEHPMKEEYDLDTPS